jgi:hypothetical protein
MMFGFSQSFYDAMPRRVSKATFTNCWQQFDQIDGVASGAGQTFGISR